MIRRLVSLSTSSFAAQLLHGPLREGAAVGHGYALFGDDVLAVTPLGAPRMPNGIETNMRLAVGEPVCVGRGELRTSNAVLRPGPLWDARPRLCVSLSVSPGWRLDPESLIGRGPGLTPLGDDILAGYLAGRALAGDDGSPIARALTTGEGQTTALSLTLLRLAARGELPEAAHRLLENGDPEPLFRFGATSGKGIAVGLGLALGSAVDHAHTVAVLLPPPAPSGRLKLAVGERLREAV